MAVNILFTRVALSLTAWGLANSGSVQAGSGEVDVEGFSIPALYAAVGCGPNGVLASSRRDGEVIVHQIDLHAFAIGVGSEGELKGAAEGGLEVGDFLVVDPARGGLGGGVVLQF